MDVDCTYKPKTKGSESKSGDLTSSKIYPTGIDGHSWHDDIFRGMAKLKAIEAMNANFVG